MTLIIVSAAPSCPVFCPISVDVKLEDIDDKLQALEVHLAICEEIHLLAVSKYEDRVRSTDWPSIDLPPLQHSVASSLSAVNDILRDMSRLRGWRVILQLRSHIKHICVITDDTFDDVEF